MEKKIPKVFQGKVEKNIGNNNNAFYSYLDDNKEENQKIEKKVKETTKNINQKINDIFSSSNYIYKANVEITLKQGKEIKNIVGKNSNYLITIDNELIPIADIIDIKRL